MYRPPHQRNVRKEVRKEFRNEFPELCPKAIVAKPMSFTHIKDIVEPEPVKVVVSRFISLKDPANYRKAEPEQVFSEERVLEAFEKMVIRWEKNDSYQHYIETYPIEYSDESEEVEETSSLEAEDPEYEIDF